MRHSWTKSAVLLAFILGISPELIGGIPGVSVSGEGRQTDRDRTVGYQFTLHRDVTVADLGKFDANRNGTLDDLVQPRVGLWDKIGTLKASVTLDDSVVLDHSAFYNSITPTTLSPGNYVIGAQMFDDQEPYLSDTRVATPNAISWDRGRRTGTAEFAFPLTNASRRLSSYFGPAFKVDEPMLLMEPVPRAVYQRDQQNIGHVKLDGLVSDKVDRVDGRAVVVEGASGKETEWQVIDVSNGTL